MRYENPSVVLFGSAAELVQQSQEDKGNGFLQDAVDPNRLVTPAAYQVDASLGHHARRKLEAVGAGKGLNSELLVEENMRCLKCKKGSPEALTDLPGWR